MRVREDIAKGKIVDGGTSGSVRHNRGGGKGEKGNTRLATIGRVGGIDIHFPKPEEDIHLGMIKERRIRGGKKGEKGLWPGHRGGEKEEENCFN